MSASLISTHKLYKRFGYRTILRDINLSINPGDFTLIIGNNGAGKSTLFHLLSGLMRPTDGCIKFKGEDYQKSIMDLRRSSGYLAHESRLYGDLTAFENLKLFGTLYQVETLKPNIEHVLEEVELGHAIHLPVRIFSSGMTKRLCIARLMLYKPKLLLLDEPFTGLDQNSVRLFCDFLQKHHEQGGTVLIITHQFSLGLKQATRIVVIQNHRVTQDTTAKGVSIEQCGLWLSQN